MTEELTLSDYMKSLEGIETSRAGRKGFPIIARLDGHGFSNFTRTLKKPYDERLSNLMRDTTKMLVEQTNALIGYTQSDEITLVWYIPDEINSEYYFGGRFQKLVGILSSKATGFFIRELDKRIPEKAGEQPEIDARVWEVPSLKDAGKVLLWRERDAIKNSISMLASSHFSHKQLHKTTGEQKKQMVRELNDPWEDHPVYFRKGSYFKRVKVVRELSPSELELIPKNYWPTGPITRTDVKEVMFPDLSTLEDLTTIFSVFI